VKTVFDNDIDLVITPIAYDMDLHVALADGWTVERMYGLPGDSQGTPAAQYNVATAFFSRKRGSIVARLGWHGTTPVDSTGVATLAYRPEPALGWPDPGTQTVDAASGTPDDDGEYYAGDGVHKATMLVNMAVQMIAACNAYSSDAEGARATVHALLAYLQA